MDRSECIDHGYKGDRHGYSQTSFKGRAAQRHRVVFALANGLDPFTMGGAVMHHCDNPRCINIDHLSLGTQLDNVADMRAKGRQSRGEHRPLAKLTARDVVAIRESTEKQATLAARFGVGQKQISYVRAGKAWAHIVLGQNGRWVGVQ